MAEVGFFIILVILGARTFRFFFRQTWSDRADGGVSSPRSRSENVFFWRFLAFAFDQVLLRGLRELLHSDYLHESLAFTYEIVGVAVFGGTLGKHLFGLEVRLLSGERATWRAAVLRELPSLCLVGLGLVVFSGLGDLDAQSLKTLPPPRGTVAKLYCGVAATYYALDLLFAAFSDRGRSLHDRLAGTEVTPKLAKSA